MPTVSAAFFTYNRYDRLKTAVESVLRQDVLPLEIIVVDDGSTDETKEIQKISPLVRYFKIEKSGAPTARNLAIEKSSGDFILWIGDDDTIERDMLSIYGDFIIMYPEVDIFYCGLNVIQSDGKIRKHHYKDWYYNRNYTMQELLFRAPFADGGSLVRRSLYDHFGRYNELFLRAQDYEFWSRVLNDKNVIAKQVPKCLYNYVMHGDNQISGEFRNKDYSYDSSVVKSILCRNTLKELFPGYGRHKEDEIKLIFTELLKRFGDLNDIDSCVKLSEYTLNNLSIDFNIELDKPKWKVYSLAKDLYPKSPVISVCMTAYNQEKFIHEAISSVLNQSFYHFELIIVDDGSLDSTVSIIKNFNDPRIVLIENEHGGFPKAVNTAIRSARSELIIQIDGDDLVEFRYIEKLLYYVKKYPDYDYYYPESLCLITSEGVKTGEEWIYENYTSSKEIIKSMFLKGFSVIPNAGSIKRKNIFDKYGYFDNLSTSEDYDFLSKYAESINFFKCSNAKGYYYRRHANNNSMKIIERCKINSDIMLKLYNRYGSDFLLDGSKFESIAQVFQAQSDRFGKSGGKFFQAISEALGGKSIDAKLRLKIGIVAYNNNLNFMSKIINHLSINHDINVYDANNSEDVAKAYYQSDLIWIEWADLNLVTLTNLPKRVPMICRFHSYEAYLVYLDKVKWENLDKLIFISPQIMKYMLLKVPQIAKCNDVSYESEGIDLSKFRFKKREHGFNLAFIGHLTLTKNIALLLQILKMLTLKDKRYKLDIFGNFALDNGAIVPEIPKRYFFNEVEKMGLGKNIVLHGHVDHNDMINLLENTNYIISSSFREGLPFNILEAMAMGIKPLIHSWPGAEQCFDDKFIFNYIGEIFEMIKGDYDSESYRDFIFQNHNYENFKISLNDLIDRIIK
ncbi:MAG: glycosyltransferase [Candidatus Delongbacteria bacterium]|nr:glycosyltransferase [Candidatus Delongbacteria bacterium]MBN2836109.1 glycosyltransferase [Candidatus Delongbacteria bacterium]